jgi:plasmid maintenance system antidote protein VapI
MQTILNYLPQPHPTRQIFRKHKIPVSAVANYLGLTTTYVNSILTGHLRVTPDNDAKLKELSRSLGNEEH